MTDKRTRNDTGTKTATPAANDSWLLDLVDDPATDRALSMLTVEDAVEDLGMTQEAAERAFMPPPPEPPVDVDDLCRMAADILIGKSGPHIDSDAGRSAWTSLRQQIEEIREQGGIVDFPND